MESFKDRTIRTYSCLNHVVHEECFNDWNKTQKLDDDFLCIFRCKKADVARTQIPNATQKGL